VVPAQHNQAQCTISAIWREAQAQQCPLPAFGPCRYEEAEAGKLKGSALHLGSSTKQELAKAQARQVQVVELLQQLHASLPHLGSELERVLCHASLVVA
jgi:hypothetical protein